MLRLERGRERAFVLMNERDAVVDVTAAFPATGVPEVWDPDTGTATTAGVWRSAPFTGERDGGTAVELRLESKATVLVVFRATREPAHAVSSTAPVERVRVDSRDAVATVRVTGPGPVEVVATAGGRRYRGTTTVADALAAVALDGDWRFRFDRPGAPETPRPLGSWTDLDSAYSGSAWYEKEIALDADVLSGRKWTLDLGAVLDVAQVEVNGAALGTRLWRPYRADVTAVLRPGTNLVRVRVTNTGANARGQVIPSGLVGPVFLRPERLVDVALTRG